MDIRIENATVAEQKQSRPVEVMLETGKSGYTLEECIMYTSDAYGNPLYASVCYYLREYAKLRAKGIKADTMQTAALQAPT